MMTGVEEDKSQTANVIGLRMTPDARDPVWELPPVHTGGSPVALIGWVTRVEPVDAGVPPPAAAVIARALTRCCRVTFAHHEGRRAGPAGGWQPTATGWIRLLEPAPFAALRKRSAIPLLSTTLPESAAGMFDAPPFVWSLKAQVALLSDLASPPPDVSYRTVRALLDREPLDATSLTSEGQIRGLLAPAVDGDFAALIAFDPEVSTCIREALADESAREGMTWEVLTEAAFRGR